MINHQDEIIFVNSKLNSDDDIQLMPSGDHPVLCTTINEGALNVEIQEGHMLARSRARGNELQSYILPSGTNKVLGGCKDIENNGYIYFVYNSAGNHLIIRYNYDETFDTIVNQDSTLNFQEDYPITAGIIGTGTEAQLWWNDGYNPPRKSNLYTLENGGYATLDVSNINLLKPSPIDTISYSFLQDTSFSEDFIVNNYFQFAYRYIYDTGEKSVLSPYTGVTFLAESYELASMVIYNGGYNYIELIIPVSYNSIDKVEILFRDADVGGGVPGVWKLYDTVEAVYPSITYNFYNDKFSSNIDQKEAEILFHAVPHTAKAMTSVMDNRLVLGGIDVGRDNLSSTTIDVVFEAVKVAFSGGTIHTRYSIANSSNQNFTVSASTTETYHKLIIYGVSGGIETYVLTSNIGKATGAAVSDYFVAEITAKTSFNITATTSGNNLNIANNDGGTIYVAMVRHSPHNKYNTFKSGSNYHVGIVYYDLNGVPGRIQKNDDMTVRIPFYDEYGGTGVENNYINGIKYTISHLPPNWATGYRFAISEGGRYFQIPIVVGSNNFGLESDVVFQDDRIEIDLIKAKERISNARNGIDTGFYDLEVGDKMRVIGKFLVGASSSADLIEVIDEYIELEILEVTADGKVYVENWNHYTNADLLNGNEAYDSLLVEFFSVVKTGGDNIVYKEIGTLLDITGGYHMADTFSSFGVSAQNQTAILPAVGTIVGSNALPAGDNYLMMVDWFDTNKKENAGSCVSWLECQSAALLKSERNPGTGRVNIYDLDYKRRSLNAISWGGAFGQTGLTFNELNKFEESSRIYLDSKYGEIVSLEEEGSSLKVIQRNKMTSIGVGYDEVALQDGTTQVYAIETEFGTPRPIMEDYGTVFPLSVIRHNRYIYFYDIYAGALLRYSPAGVENISGLGKMGKWFRYKSRQLLDSGISNIHVSAGFDTLHGLYVLTFIDDYDSGNNETIAYHEDSGTFKTYYSFVQEHYGNIGKNIFLSFNAGRCYKHHSDSVNRGVFNGTAYDSKLWFVSNKSPLQTKRFVSIIENANYVWKAEGETDVIVFSDSKAFRDAESYVTYRGDMYSSLYEKRFKYREGNFVTNFMRDSRSSGSTFSAVDLYNGRQLRGKGILIKLTNSDTDEAYIRSVIVNSSIS